MGCYPSRAQLVQPTSVTINGGQEAKEIVPAEEQLQQKSDSGGNDAAIQTINNDDLVENGPNYGEGKEQQESDSSLSGSSSSIMNSKNTKDMHVIASSKSNSGPANGTPKNKSSPNGGRIKWKKGELIGAGSYGKVFIGLSESTGVLMAVKEVHVSSKKEVEALQQEVRLIRSLKHDNIVQYLGSEADPRLNVVYIFTQWVPGGSLSTLLQKFGRLSESVVSNYTKQILQGLAYLHKKGIIHRDIKGGNILVDDKGKIKLADFGASKVLNCGASNGSILENQSLRGTPYFMAPEVIMQSGHGRKADIWSVGCTVIQMVSGKPPWKSMRFTSISALLFHICNTTEPPPMPDSISPTLRSFLMITFQRDPSERPSCSTLLQHPFVNVETEQEPSIDEQRRTETPRFNIGDREEPASSSGNNNNHTKTTLKMKKKQPVSVSVTDSKLIPSSNNNKPSSNSNNKKKSAKTAKVTPKAADHGKQILPNNNNNNNNNNNSEKLTIGNGEEQRFLNELSFSEQVAASLLTTGMEQINDRDDDGQLSVEMKVPVVDELQVTSYLRIKARESEKRRDQWYQGKKKTPKNKPNAIKTSPDPDNLNEWTIRENTVINTVEAQKIRVLKQKQEQVLLQRKKESEEKWQRELAEELAYQRRSGLRT